MSDLRATLQSKRDLGRNIDQATREDQERIKNQSKTNHNREAENMSAPITIIGNVVGDPELKFLQSAKALATFTVVSSKSSKKPDGTWENTDTTFWDVKAWGKTAENVADSLRKGVSVIISGTAVQESWDDKNTGAKRSKISITAWNIGVDLKRHSYSVSTVERSDASYNPPASVSEFDPWTTPLGRDVAPF